MTPEQLLTFAAVAEHRNISRAARALFLSQPAVSGQLKQLQDELGEPLYHRDGRGIALTEAGRQLALHAQRLRTDYREALAFRDALRSLDAGHLRIGASTTPASYVLPYLISAFHQRHAGVTISTRYGNTAEVLAGIGELDIALIEGETGVPLPPGTALHEWKEDEIVAVVPLAHPLARRGAPDGVRTSRASSASSASSTSGASDPRALRDESAARAEVPLDALAAHPIVLRERGSGVRQTVERAFERHALQMRVAIELAGVEGIKEAVRAGMGVGFVSAMSMRHEDNALVALSIAPPDRLTRHLTIVVPHGAAPLRAVDRFVDLCLQFA
ncbi:LysR family transcriptional regulator [Pararobbsia silviterrae]|uniref:LysR family transcriptional regulator n=1 Tax=Pararobbsia silviterrae TaxID=1792498 RepID=A0A494XUK6_9BURK|nr:LysR family transcriptional regulator [Pararobbsia silviterrae]RKP51794.1 LysR family transcriptional regulator [Pararobbsia silviterrae]